MDKIVYSELVLYISKANTECSKALHHQRSSQTNHKAKNINHNTTQSIHNTLASQPELLEAISTYSKANLEASISEAVKRKARVI